MPKSLSIWIGASEVYRSRGTETDKRVIISLQEVAFGMLSTAGMMLLCAAAAATGATGDKSGSRWRTGPRERTPCPAGLTMMARFAYSIPPGSTTSSTTSGGDTAGRTVPVVACEDLSTGNGSIVFTAAGAPFPVTMRKRVHSNVDTGASWMNWSKEEVLGAKVDLLGNSLLGIHGFPPRAGDPWAVWDRDLVSKW